MNVSAALVAILLVAGLGFARAQTPPSAAEVSAYEGLHAAAARGDAAVIR